MVKLTLNQIVYATKAKVDGLDEKQTIATISTDTRTITKGSLFVALSGENFNGSDYALTAIEKGAVAVVVEDGTNLPTEKVLLVENTSHALLTIAGLHRDSCRAKIVAITGSVGKTTTKEMTAAVLSAGGKTLKTEANLNNEVGVAHMLLKLDDTYDYAVLEVGVDGPDQMLPMTMAVKPDIAIVTNIGASHLEAFGTVENIQKEKLALEEGLKIGGAIILNGDDPLLLGKARVKESYYYGIRSLSAEVQARNIEYHNESTDFCIHYKNKTHCITLNVAGKHNVMDALAAFTAGELLGVSWEKSVEALKEYRPEGMRQKTVKFKGCTVVEDCYNASPSSMKAALDTLGRMKTAGRRIAVLGDMLELGPEEATFHKEVGKEAAKQKIDLLLCTGPLSKHLADGAKAAGLDNTHYFETKAEAAAYLMSQLKPDDIVWVKASRGMKMEELLEKIYG